MEPPKEGNTWRGRSAGEHEKEEACILEMADAGWTRTEGGV